jgi:hypothetical protein
VFAISTSIAAELADSEQQRGKLLIAELPQSSVSPLHALMSTAPDHG